jgi:hypothetical protein
VVWFISLTKTLLQVKFANKKNLPFLAYNSAHGAITTLGQMTQGIEIYLNQLSGVKIAEDGKSVTILGGTKSKLVTHTLWEAGKQTGKRRTADRLARILILS